MSSSAVEADVVCCANCGITEVGDIKLMDCGGCELVKYCGDKCKEEHREQHEEECKKREEVLHDKKLFRQPDGSDRGECPLCFLPMPLDVRKSTFYSCCSKIICDGCEYANYIRNTQNNCPFCREPGPKDDEENDRRKMKRIKANDPAALCHMGMKRYQEGDYDGAFEYWTKAAELGDSEAHYQLACMYRKGEGVVEDVEKVVYHCEKAAIGGHPTARHNLGCLEGDSNKDRAVKHFIIAANLGYEKSMKALWEHYSLGNITEEDLDATLRTHHAAINEMKSPEREEAEAWRERQRGA